MDAGLFGIVSTTTLSPEAPHPAAAVLLCARQILVSPAGADSCSCFPLRFVRRRAFFSLRYSCCVRSFLGHFCSRGVVATHVLTYLIPVLDSTPRPNNSPARPDSLLDRHKGEKGLIKPSPVVETRHRRLRSQLASARVLALTSLGTRKIGRTPSL